MTTEFYEQVPKTFDANMAYRAELRKLCAHDKHFRRHVWEMCRQDFLFWLSAFCFLYEPRPRFDAVGNVLPRTIPFIPWEHQVPAFLTIRENLGKNDIAVFKSRGEGLSWGAVLMALYDWLFEDMAKVGLVSRTEEMADTPGNLDSLLAKFEWELAQLPTWMSGVLGTDYKRNINDHSFVNLRNGSQTNAFASTGDAGRAGRYKWFLADELGFWDRGKDRKFMESIRESTECRLAISTPNGNDGAFYDMVHVPSNVSRVRIHWTQNPSKNRGLYKLEGGVPVAVDPENNPLLGGYSPMSSDVEELYARLRTKGFRLDGCLRSPWYDKQCDRADATPQSIAQELDLDFGGSMFRVFSPEFMTKAKETCLKPILQGDLSYSTETWDMEFMPRKNGECKLWCQLDANGNPPLGSYVIGADIGSGLGGSYTSNSVCQVINRVTCEQVLEFTSNTIEPADFGELCTAIAKWFYDAYMGWEANGCGAAFTARVKKVQYGNIYYRTVKWRKGRKKLKEIGWWTDQRTKEMLFSDLHTKVRTNDVVMRSEDLVRECGDYVRTGPNSSIEYIHKLSTLDESSKGMAHGDRVIAFAVALQLLEDRPVYETEDVRPKGPPPPDTMAWRIEQWARQKQDDDWDDTTLWDVSLQHAGDGFLD